MLAVAEAAFRGQCRHGAERAHESLVASPELQFARAGSVDQERSPGERHEFAPRRHVVAARIAFVSKVGLVEHDDRAAPRSQAAVR